MNRIERLLRELRRRKVFQTVVTYVIIALGIVEAAELTLPRLGFDDSAVTLVLVIVLLGLPVVVFLSWALDVRAEIAGSEKESGEVPITGSRRTTLVAVGTALIVVLAGWWMLSTRPEASVPPTSVAPGRASSIAVLPFRDLSPNQDHGWFGEGLAEEILGTLTRLPGLEVFSSQSSFALSNASVSEINRRLGATHVLSGSVRTEGDRARIQAQLVRAEDEEVLWSRDFRPRLTNVLDAQEQIARAVASTLRIELGALAAAAPGGAVDPVAYEHYLRGLQLWDRRAESDILSAIGHFRTAVDRDSLYAAAWAGLAYAYLVLPEYSPTANVRRTRDQAAEAARRSLELDPAQADALTAMGWIRAVQHYDWPGAEDFISRALEVDSTNINALHWQSHVVSWRGRHDEAVALAERATQLDPLSQIMRQNLAFILMEARRYEAALRELARVLSDEQDFPVSLRTTWNVRTRTGDFEGAADALREWLVRIGRDAGDAASISAAFEIAAERFANTGRGGSLPPGLIDRLRPGNEVETQLYAAVGDGAATLEALERAYRERAGSRAILSIGVNPLYDFLRDDPRFRDLTRRVGLSR